MPQNMSRNMFDMLLVKPVLGHVADMPRNMFDMLFVKPVLGHVSRDMPQNMFRGRVFVFLGGTSTCPKTALVYFFFCWGTNKSSNPHAIDMPQIVCDIAFCKHILGHVRKTNRTKRCSKNLSVWPALIDSAPDFKVWTN